MFDSVNVGLPFAPAATCMAWLLTGLALVVAFVIKLSMRQTLLNLLLYQITVLVLIVELDDLLTHARESKEHGVQRLPRVVLEHRP